MSTEQSPSGGLRERKKRATRQALSDAALTLSVEHGLPNVRIEDIAAEAGVSERTFRNYFATKYEAVVWRQLDRTRRSVEVLRERPAAENLWDAITEAILAPLLETGQGMRAPDPDTLAAVRLTISEPVLRAELFKATLGAERAFAETVAQRTGTDVDRDVYPGLVAAAVSAASRVATEHWMSADPPVPLVPLVRTTLRQLAAGLPEPSQGDSR